MTFDEWFLSKQGEPYDSMYVFARDAWNAALSAEREECAKVCDAMAEYRRAFMRSDGVVGKPFVPKRLR